MNGRKPSLAKRDDGRDPDVSRTPQRRRPRRKRHPGRWIVLVLLLSLGAAGTAYYLRQGVAEDGAVQAVGLRTEYLTNPLGIDAAQPRLSWVPSSAEELMTQRAYQVQVAESLVALSDGTPLLWDSGKTEASQNWNVTYAGSPLVSGGQYIWRVRLWDSSDLASDWSDPATWQTGLLDESAWSGASWIAASTETSPAEVLMRRSFQVDAGDVTHATLTIAGLGFHVAYLNGSQVGDSQMAPSWTDYSDHIEYVTYDVTDMVKNGEENVLGVALAGGWYNPVGQDATDLSAMEYVDQEKLRCRLEIQHTGGASVTVVSDDQWQWATGEVTYASIYGGEDIDHTKTLENWSSPGGSTSQFAAVTTNAAPSGEPVLVAAAYPPERSIGTVSLSSQKTSSGYLYTLGENTAVTLMLIVTGTPGTTVRLQVGEGLSENEVDPAWHDLNKQVGTSRWQQANFTLGSSGSETFKTSFTYFAGSYIDLQVTEGTLSAEPTLQAYEVHTDLTSTGSFSSSDEKLNTLHEAVLRTYLNNLHGYPTANPQRDRLGSGIEGAALAETGLLNFDSATIYAKWMADLRDAQLENGSIPASAPAATDDASSVSPWSGNAIVTVPLSLYRVAGDQQLLEEQYEAMHSYTDYLLSCLTEWLWTTQTSSADPQAMDPGDASALNTIGVFVAVEALVEAADILGKDEDMYVYREKGETIRSAFNTRWFDTSRHTYTRQAGAAFKLASQSTLAAALATGIVPDDEDEGVYSSLLADIAAPTVGTKYANHLVTGVVGTQYLFQILTEAGETDLAYQLLTQQDYPSVFPGASSSEGTLYERIADAGLSHDSTGFGSFDTWLFHGIGGIFLDDLITSNLIRIRPGPITGVEWAEAEIITMFGTVSSRWERTSTGMRYRIVVPVGVTAEVSVIATSGNVIRGSSSIATFTDPYDAERQVLHLQSGTYVIETR